MSETQMLTVKTGFDSSGLLEMEKKTLAMVETLRGRLSKFNGSTSLKPDTREFAKELEKIKQELDSLAKERKSTLAKLDSVDFRKDLAELESRLRELNSEQNIAIALDEGELESIFVSLDSFSRRLNEATKNMFQGVWVNEELTNAVSELAKEYATREALATQLAVSEQEKEESLTKIRKEHAEERIKLLQAEAERQMRLSDDVSAETVANIHAVRRELAELTESIGEEDILKAMTNIGAPLKELAKHLNTLYSTNTNIKIASLEKAKKQELALIDETLASEKAMLDEQLEQYAELDKEKESLTKDHTERMEELNSRMQEHLTEEEWRTIQEQMDAETLSYEESMAALQADTEARDALRAEKELAEQQALSVRSSWDCLPYVGFSGLETLFIANYCRPVAPRLFPVKSSVQVAA